MLFVRKLVWDSWNIKHIYRHHIIPEEVEDICHSDPLVLRGQQKERLVLIGLSKANRMIAVVLEGQGRGVYYPITAYEPDEKDKTLYRRLKGGDKK